MNIVFGLNWLPQELKQNKKSKMIHLGKKKKVRTVNWYKKFIYNGSFGLHEIGYITIYGTEDSWRGVRGEGYKLEMWLERLS